MQVAASIPVFKRVSDLDGWRWYYREGHVNKPSEWYASVTNVLSIAVPKYLKNYMMRTSQRKQTERLTEASEIGTRAHEIIESDLLGKHVTRVDLDDVLRIIYDGWLKLETKHSITARHVEVPVASSILGFGGTLDLVGNFEGKSCIMDLKTGNFGKSVGLQLAAYRLAWKELTGENLGMVGLSIRCKRALQTRQLYAETNAFRYEHLQYCESAFLSCFNTWKATYSTKLDRMNWKYRGLHAVPAAPWGS